MCLPIFTPGHMPSARRSARPVASTIDAGVSLEGLASRSDRVVFASAPSPVDRDDIGRSSQSPAAALSSKQNSRPPSLQGNAAQRLAGGRLIGSPVSIPAQESGVQSGGLLNRPAPERRKPLKFIRRDPAEARQSSTAPRSANHVGEALGPKALRPPPEQRFTTDTAGRSDTFIRRPGEQAGIFLDRVTRSLIDGRGGGASGTATAAKELLRHGDVATVLRQQALSKLQRHAIDTRMSSAEFLRRAQAIRDVVPVAISDDAKRVAGLPLPVIWLLGYGLPAAAGAFYLQQNKDRLVPRGFITPGRDALPEFPLPGFSPDFSIGDEERFPEAGKDSNSRILAGPEIRPVEPKIQKTPDHRQVSSDARVLFNNKIEAEHALNDPERLRRIADALEKQGIEFEVFSGDELRDRRRRGIVASMMDLGNGRVRIGIMPDAGPSALFEELIHSAHKRSGRFDRWTTLYDYDAAVTKSEYEVAKKLVRNRHAYRIPLEEHEQNLKNLRQLEQEMKDKGMPLP